jgi:hypothetical protein
MTKKIHDLSVKVGTYEKDGQTKNRYLNIGIMLEKDDGGRFILLDRTFNPAGCPNPDGKSTVMVSMFDVDKKPQKKEAPQPKDDLNDDVPF